VPCVADLNPHIRKTALTIFKVVVTTFDPVEEEERLYALKARGVRPPSNG
jgi:hypothetical protein